MAQQSNEAPRRGAAVAVAAAGLTLAAGVTVGVMIGWVRPPAAPTPETVEAPISAASEDPAPAPPAPAIPAPARAADPEAEPGLEPEVVALERPRERHGHHERGERSERGERREHHGGGDDD
jgi:hypothetical protein